MGRCKEVIFLYVVVPGDARLRTRLGEEVMNAPPPLPFLPPSPPPSFPFVDGGRPGLHGGLVVEEPGARDQAAHYGQGRARDHLGGPYQ